MVAEAEYMVYIGDVYRHLDAEERALVWHQTA